MVQRYQVARAIAIWFLSVGTLSAGDLPRYESPKMPET